MISDHRLDPIINELYPSPWRRSLSGNLWRWWMGYRITIFCRGRWWYYHWCIAPRDGPPEFGGEGYPTEEEAIQAVFWELEGRM